jgi:hypothetical protein
LAGFAPAHIRRGRLVPFAHAGARPCLPGAGTTLRRADVRAWVPRRTLRVTLPSQRDRPAVRRRPHQDLPQ